MEKQRNSTSEQTAFRGQVGNWVTEYSGLRSVVCWSRGDRECLAGSRADLGLPPDLVSHDQQFHSS